MDQILSNGANNVCDTDNNTYHNNHCTTVQPQICNQIAYTCNQHNFNSQHVNTVVKKPTTSSTSVKYHLRDTREMF